MTDQPKHNLPQWPDLLPFDIRMETLAASLLELDARLDGKSSRIRVRPLGPVHRPSAKEVAALSDSNFDADGEVFFYMDIHRAGLYDNLPDLLFIDPTVTSEEPVEKARDLDRQRVAARRWLGPFEQLFFETRIETERQERTALRELPPWLDDFWGLHGTNIELNEAEKKCLYFLLPVAIDRLGKPGEVAACISALIGRLAEVKRLPSKTQAIPPGLAPALGECFLGLDLIIGEEFSDGLSSWEISINDIPAEEVEDFLPGGRRRALLEEIALPRFFPFETAVGILPVVRPEEQDFTLTSSGFQSILGTVTHLQPSS